MTLAPLVDQPARAADRPAAKILEEINGVQMPQLATADRGDRKLVQEFMTKRQVAMDRKAKLIGDLYQQYPDNPALNQLLPERWQAMLASPKTTDAAMGEIDTVIKSGKNEKLASDAGVLKTLVNFRKAGLEAKPEVLLGIVDEFTKRFPKDPRGAEMLTAVAGLQTIDPALKDTIVQRIEKEYPDSPVVAGMKAESRLRDAVGKPFEVDFSDAITGTKVNSASLKGKVVVIDFWATWCGPCVGEMPKMKALYAKYKDKGVEFIGVSLDAPRDQGGFDKLKDFVKDNKIEWPQYYEGKPSASDFATGWGIKSIPTVFAVDADGNLATTEARGKLEELIPELLAKAGKSDTSKDKKTASARP